MEAAAAVESSATVSAFEVSKRPDTAKLVLNSPGPPSLREELAAVVGKAFRPRASGGGRAPRCAWVLTALQCVFPVLQWGRSYTLKSFRSDVMAGLTLASLGIPQVGSFPGSRPVMVVHACSSILNFQLLLHNALFVFT